MVPHKRVVDIQRLLVFVAIRVERAIIHVNGDVLRAGFSVDVDDLTGCVKGAGVKRHDRRAVGPQGIVSIRGVERSAVELSGGVAPVERLAVNDTMVNDSLIGADEAKVVCVAGTQRHLLERYSAGAIEGIVAVVLGAKVGGIGHECADVPCGFIVSLAHKGEVLVLGVAHGAHAVEGVVALAELDGVAAFRLGGGGGKIVVACTGAGIGDRAGSAVCKSRRREAYQDKRSGNKRSDRTICRSG